MESIRVLSIDDSPLGKVSLHGLKTVSSSNLNPLLGEAEAGKKPDSSSSALTLRLPNRGGSGKNVLCTGVVSNGEKIEGIIGFRVEKDGNDATEKTINAIKNSRFGRQVRAIIMHSVTLAGLNILDVKRISGELKIPIICVTKEKPKEGEIEKAIGKVFGKRTAERKLELLRNAGSFHKTKNFHFQIYGITEKEANGILNQWKGYPEPLRIAHLIGSAMVKGESKGRA